MTTTTHCHLCDRMFPGTPLEHFTAMHMPEEMFEDRPPMHVRHPDEDE
jgi:hypothetical protein